MPHVDSIDALPSAVIAALTSEDSVEANRTIRSDFGLRPDQYDYMLEVLRGIVLGDIPVLELPEKIAKMPGSGDINLSRLALRIAIDRLWPLQDYLGTVDELIRRLGGTVPAPIPLPSAAEVTDEDDEEEIVASAAPGPLVGPAKEMLRTHKQFESMYVTQKPVIDDTGHLQAPTVTNWLNDYLHVMGAAGRSSLKRSEYLVKSRNALKLNEAEKENLLNFLLSYDDGVLVYWTVAEGQYLLVTVEQEKEKSLQKEKAPEEAVLQSIVKFYTTTRDTYEQRIADKKPGVSVEAGDQTSKLSDVIWDALAMGETDRCIAACALLIERHGLLEMLKLDQRYKGIVTRYISVTYGVEAKNFWNGDMTTAVIQCLFWRLLLAEKLKLPLAEAAVVADYFSKLIGTGSMGFANLQSGKYEFREIMYDKRVLRFA